MLNRQLKVYCLARACSTFGTSDVMIRMEFPLVGDAARAFSEPLGYLANPRRADRHLYLK